jgi:cytochrome c oxidase subunit III
MMRRVKARTNSKMVSSLLPPPVAAAREKKAPSSDHNGNGPGGGDIDYPRDDRRNNPEPDPERWATPLRAYRTASLFVIFSIMSIFATLTHVLESRWVHSKDWVSIALPHILYVNTLVLVMSSFTMELARSAAGGQKARACARWLLATLLLGFVFVGGQLVAWRELVMRGLYVASNPGSFFFYSLTATHALHLLGGLLALAGVVLFAGSLARKNQQQTAIGVMALYWHFMDVLWLYLFALLFATIQR